MARTLTRSYHRIATTHKPQLQTNNSSGCKVSKQHHDENFHHPLPLRLIMGQRIAKTHEGVFLPYDPEVVTSSGEQKWAERKLQKKVKMVHFSDDSTTSMVDDTTATLSRQSPIPEDVEEDHQIPEPQDQFEEQVQISQAELAKLYRQQVQEDLQRAMLEYYNAQMKNEAYPMEI